MARWSTVSGYLRAAVWCAAGLGCGATAWAQQASKPRALAPGVLRVIPPSPEVDETRTGPGPLVELSVRKDLDWTPHYAPKTRTIYTKAQRVTLRRGIWYFEFAFKPLRLIDVDVPQASGKMQRKRIWYLVYRVRYLGNEMVPTKGPDGEPRPLVGESDAGRYFFPQFLLTLHELNKTYLDQVIPAALEPIRKREKPDGPLHDSVTISSRPIPLSKGGVSKPVWGVATWTDVDPRADYLSVDVKGLTNAYRPVDPPGVYKPGDPPGKGRQFLTKTLRLHFWKPGDDRIEHDDEVRFGIPVDEDPAMQAAIVRVYGSRRRVDYEWLYR